MYLEHDKTHHQMITILAVSVKSTEVMRGYETAENDRRTLILLYRIPTTPHKT